MSIKLVLIDTSSMVFDIIFQSRKEFFNNKKNKELDNFIENKEFVSILWKNSEKIIYKIMDKHIVSGNRLYFIRDCSLEKNWRIKIYPLYKGHRKKLIKHNGNNFDIKNICIYFYQNILPKIINKINSNSIKISGAEADDIIGAFVIKYHYLYDIIIISKDHDFIQLLKYKNIKLYSSCGENIEELLMKKTIYYDDWIKQNLGHEIRQKISEEFLLKKIMKGDKSDNINYCINNDIDIYLNNIDLLEILFQNNENIKIKFELNRQLIDFNYIPSYIYKQVDTEFKKINSTYSI